MASVVVAALQVVTLPFVPDHLGVLLGVGLYLLAFVPVTLFFCTRAARKRDLYLCSRGHAQYISPVSSGGPKLLYSGAPR